MHAPAQAATLNLSPVSGSFTVGSTFSVSVMLDSENESINTIGLSVSFPADKLQLVSPSTGNSIISIWTTLPRVDNHKGTLELQGGIPGGIKSSAAIVTTMVFRVTSVGSAVVKINDTSKVLLNNGQGTDSLRQKTNGVYSLVLPPPAGPIVSSPTHPDQSKWYSNPSAVLNWAPEQNVDGYSYMLSDNPADLPDDISEGTKQSVVYKNLGDAVRFFHIKSLKDGSWGGVTHFALKIDTTPPADFPIDIIPEARTDRKQPIVQFATTDAASGIDHYQLKLIALSPDANNEFAGQPLFVEVNSPYVTPELDLGAYDVIVRAFDIAGNHREVTTRLTVVNPLFTVVRGEGVRLSDSPTIPWMWVWIVLLIILIVVSFIAWRVRAWHHRLRDQRASRELPDKLKRDMDELRMFREKYGKIACALVFAFLLIALPVRADNTVTSPPIIDTVSRSITNEDIFYVGGKSDTGGSIVVIYLQNLSTGETLNETVTVDARGSWFYRHSGFLTSGNYLLWAQNKIGDQVSPPSPQETIQVRTTAIHVGSSRLTMETMYLGITIAALLFLGVLAVYIIWHAKRGTAHKRQLLSEIRAAEEAIRRGFAVIRRDIQSELEIIRKVKLDKNASFEEKKREELLLQDLENIEQSIGKEIWELEQTEAGSPR